MKLNVKAFGLTSGMVWGFGIFFMTWWMIFLEGVTGDLTFLGHLYLGYNISPMGSVIGMIWGFFDGLIVGSIFAWVYNFIAARTSPS